MRSGHATAVPMILGVTEDEVAALLADARAASEANAYVEPPPVRRVERSLAVDLLYDLARKAPLYLGVGLALLIALRTA